MHFNSIKSELIIVLTIDYLPKKILFQLLMQIIVIILLKIKKVIILMTIMIGIVTIIVIMILYKMMAMECIYNENKMKIILTLTIFSEYNTLLNTI